MISLFNFMRMYQLVQNLSVGDHRPYGDVMSLTFLYKLKSSLWHHQSVRLSVWIIVTPAASRFGIFFPDEIPAQIQRYLASCTFAREVFFLWHKNIYSFRSDTFCLCSSPVRGTARFTAQHDAISTFTVWGPPSEVRRVCISEGLQAGCGSIPARLVLVVLRNRKWNAKELKWTYGASDAGMASV
jgi:hypothetical protein